MTAVGVVGTGYWGKNLVRNFRSLGVLVAICDVSAAARERILDAAGGVKIYDSEDRLFADPNVTSVAIATPAATHGALVMAALAAGKHVFVEKPLCLDIDEGNRLAAEAERRGLTLMIGHMLLYHPAFIAIKALIDANGIGALRYLYSTRLALGKIRREENALWSFAPHDISMILALTGRMPTRVAANGAAYLTPAVADTTLSHLSFTDQLQAHIFVSWLHPYKDQRMIIVGSEGMTVFNDVAQGPEKLLLYPHKVSWDGDISTVDMAEAQPIPYDSAEPLRLECEHFIDCVRTGRRPRSDAAEAIRVLHVLDACQRSLTSGEPVEMASS